MCELKERVDSEPLMKMSLRKEAYAEPFMLLREKR